METCVRNAATSSAVVIATADQRHRTESNMKKNVLIDMSVDRFENIQQRCAHSLFKHKLNPIMVVRHRDYDISRCDNLFSLDVSNELTQWSLFRTFV